MWNSFQYLPVIVNVASWTEQQLKINLVYKLGATFSSVLTLMKGRTDPDLGEIRGGAGGWLKSTGQPVAAKPPALFTSSRSAEQSVKHGLSF